MRMAAVQFKATRGDKAGSLARLRRLAERAAVGADVVVLPEMAATGYAFPSTSAVATVAEDPRGDTFAALSPVARANRCWIVVGLPEAAGDRYFNSALVIDPAGELAFTYRKTLLYDADTTWATPGDSGYRRFECQRGAFTVGICMDLNDDRFIAWCAAAQVSAVALPTNWLEEFEPVWPYWMARVRWTGAALIAANTWGAEEGLLFSGRSAILDGSRVFASGPWAGDAVVRAGRGWLPPGP